MELEGVEVREVEGRRRRVFVVHPTDDEDRGGKFMGRSDEFGLVDGQELWVDGLNSDYLDDLEDDPELAVEDGLIKEIIAGAIHATADYRLYLAEYRDAVFPPHDLLSTNHIQESGPTIWAKRGAALEMPAPSIYPDV